MTRLADMLPPEEAHVVRTILSGTRAWCEAHGETPEDAQLHAALDATTWVHALVDGTLKLVRIEAIVVRETTTEERHMQMRMT